MCEPRQNQFRFPIDLWVETFFILTFYTTNVIKAFSASGSDDIIFHLSPVRIAIETKREKKSGFIDYINLRNGSYSLINDIKIYIP